MESWVWWIMTCLGGFYFVYLLLEFNKPHQQLVEQIDIQESRHHEMRGRLTRVEENIQEMNAQLESLELQPDRTRGTQEGTASGSQFSTPDVDSVRQLHHGRRG